VLTHTHTRTQTRIQLVHRTVFGDRDCVVKTRPVKKYRLPELDKKLSASRTNREVKMIRRCAELGVRVPEVFYVDKKNRRFFMEYLNGVTVKKFLFENMKSKEMSDQVSDVAVQIGETIAVMHDARMIHGDLTTSNMMLLPGKDDDDDKLCLAVIDFGLGTFDSKEETKAVDLYVLERAFNSTHPNSEQIFKLVLDSYSKKSKKWASVGKRFEQVRLRGRKRECFG